MTDSGTIQVEDTLSTPKTEGEYFDLMNAAVSKGDTEEVNRLMTLEWKPDPDADTDTTTTTETAPVAVEEVKEVEGGEPKKEPEVSQPTAVAEQPPARVPEQNETKVETPEEKLVKLEAELQRLRSDAGRVGHLQSRLAQLERQAQLKDAVKKAKPSEPAEKTDLEKKIEEKIKNLKDVDSDTAELLEAMRAEARELAKAQAYQATESLTETITQQDIENNLRQEFNKVLDVHPEFDNIRKHVYWERWKDGLTPEQRAWAESDRADQVIAAVGAFKAQMAAYAQPAAVTPPAPVETQTPPVEAVVDATKQAREQRLNASTTSKDSTIKNGGVVDVDKMFSEMYNQTLKESGQLK